MLLCLLLLLLLPDRCLAGFLRGFSLFLLVFRLELLLMLLLSLGFLRPLLLLLVPLLDFLESFEPLKCGSKGRALRLPIVTNRFAAGRIA